MIGVRKALEASWRATSAQGAADGFLPMCPAASVAGMFLAANKGSAKSALENLPPHDDDHELFRHVRNWLGMVVREDEALAMAAALQTKTGT